MCIHIQTFMSYQSMSDLIKFVANCPNGTDLGSVTSIRKFIHASVKNISLKIYSSISKKMFEINFYSSISKKK